MPNHNSLPPQRPEGEPRIENAPAPHQEIIQYSDGVRSLVYRRPGDEIDLNDPGSKYTYGLGSADGLNVAILRTASGNKYGIGMGLIINSRELTVQPTLEQLPPVKIGQRWDLPDGGWTSRVVAIEFDYNFTDKNSEPVQIPRPSPFPLVRQELQRQRQELGLDLPPVDEKTAASRRERLQQALSKVISLDFMK